MMETLFYMHKTFNECCVAVDYLLVNPEVEDALVKELQVQITEQYGENPKEGTSPILILSLRCRQEFSRAHKVILSYVLHWRGWGGCMQYATHAPLSAAAFPSTLSIFS